MTDSAGGDHAQSERDMISDASSAKPALAHADMLTPGLALTFETRPWHRADDDYGLSRRERMAARGPYHAAITPAIANLGFALASEVEAESAEAAAEIARFDADISHVLPGLQDSRGEFAPLSSVLLRTESASSSQIEDVAAGAKALALASIDERSGPNAVLVAGNVEAMRTAIAMSDHLDVVAIRAAHQALLASTPQAEPGEFRQQQVWIGGRGNSPHTATFVPPHHERVPAAMKDLVRFCERFDLAPLTQAALAHAQFETIHPFLDGNGRTGRTLVHAMLRRARTTRRVTVPVSAGLLTDTQSYFDALTAYRQGDAARIVSRFSQAALVAVRNGRELVEDLAEIYAGWTDRLTVRRDAAAWRVLPLLLRQPAVNVATIREASGVSQPAAQNAADQLVRAEVLAPASENRRNRVWTAPEVTSALDAFAVRAGRRGY